VLLESALPDTKAYKKIHVCYSLSINTCADKRWDILKGPFDVQQDEPSAAFGFGHEITSHFKRSIKMEYSRLV
jgi:hypothetical protein